MVCVMNDNTGYGVAGNRRAVNNDVVNNADVNNTDVNNTAKKVGKTDIPRCSEERSEERVLTGKISGVYGVKGWVRVFSYTDPLENILNYSTCYLNIGGNWIRRELREGKRHGKGIVAHFLGCDTRDDAAALLSTEIAVDREQLPVLKENEFYWADLVGLTVVTVDGVVFGKVVQLLQTGANDVLVVKGDRERCIPYIQPDVVCRVSLQDKLIEVDWDPEF